MSAWTDVRDQIEQGLGIQTPQAAVKTAGDVLRPIALPTIQAVTQPPGRTPVLTPPEDPATSRSSGFGTVVSKVESLGIPTLALIALGAYVLLEHKPRRI